MNDRDFADGVVGILADVVVMVITFLLAYILPTLVTLCLGITRWIVNRVWDRYPTFPDAGVIALSWGLWSLVGLYFVSHLAALSDVSTKEALWLCLGVSSFLGLYIASCILEDDHGITPMAPDPVNIFGFEPDNFTVQTPEPKQIPMDTFMTEGLYLGDEQQITILH